MSELVELIGWVEDLGGYKGVHTFAVPKLGDYLMLQSQNLDIPLLVEFDPLAGTVSASGQSQGKWHPRISASAPRLATGELLEIELRFSTDGAEIWIAGSLRLHYPTPVSPSSVRKVFGTSSFTYAGVKDVDAPAVASHRRIVTSLDSFPRVQRQARYVFDVGMGDGIDVDFYLKKGFHVIAVEPNPTAIAEAARRYSANLADGTLTLLNMAVSTERNRYPFYVNTAVPGWSSVKHEIAARGHGIVELEVPVAPLSDMLQASGGAYYVKCSTEGFDNIALSSLNASRERPKYLSALSVDESMFNTLKDLGYQRIKLVSIRSIPLLRCPKPAREGNLVDFKFGSSSSGPFGEESPGAWMTGAAAQRAVATYLERKAADQNTEAMMIHASREG